MAAPSPSSTSRRIFSSSSFPSGTIIVTRNYLKVGPYPPSSSPGNPETGPFRISGRGTTGMSGRVHAAGRMTGVEE